MSKCSFTLVFGAHHSKPQRLPHPVNLQSADIAPASSLWTDTAKKPIFLAQDPVA